MNVLLAGGRRKKGGGWKGFGKGLGGQSRPVKYILEEAKLNLVKSSRIQ